MKRQMQVAMILIGIGAVILGYQVWLMVRQGAVPAIAFAPPEGAEESQEKQFFPVVGTLAMGGGLFLLVLSSQKTPPRNGSKFS